MDIKITPYKYHKSQVGEDGVTHTIDTSKTYIGHMLAINEIYHVESREEVLEQTISDLRGLVQNLEELLEKERMKARKEPCISRDK